MDRRLAVKLIRLLYDARSHGDVQAIEKLIAPEASLHIIGSPEHSPTTKQVSGAEAFLEAVAKLSNSLELTDFEIITLLVDGPKIAVHSRCKVRHLASGRSAQMDLMDIWTTKRGKVVSLVQAFDTAHAAWVLGAAPSGATPSS
jgi:ketosteroid isomerase-like protein